MCMQNINTNELKFQPILPQRPKDLWNITFPFFLCSESLESSSLGVLASLGAPFHALAGWKLQTPFFT